MDLPSSLPLDWPRLCAHVRRPWLADHRGELPPRRGAAALRDAPVGIAACAQFSQRHAFATEAEAETWRTVGPRAQHICNLWNALRHAREDVRRAIEVVRHWQADGDTGQARLAAADVERHWAYYRRSMRYLARQLDAVRQALTPPAAARPDMPALLQAAE
jgi:hypothetical protein